MENIDLGALKWLIIGGVIMLITPLGKKKGKSSKKKKKLRGIKTYTEKGEYVKSKAEARIANYLKSRGVNYEYEKKFNIL